jgi:hypothetical protein
VLRQGRHQIRVAEDERPDAVSLTQDLQELDCEALGTAGAGQAGLGGEEDIQALA